MDYMEIIICLDKDCGYEFAGKRQSVDREIRKRILALGKKIRCDEYSASQFEENERSALYGGNDYLSARMGTAFIERGEVPLEAADRIIVFWWNRKYPSTRRLAIPKDFRSILRDDFPGYSHERITMEVFEKSR